MTLQQLKYVITVADTGTITEAANKLYISQPSLTNAIHELEKEMNIVIFNRTNKGISLSKEGEIFLGYARQVLEQAAILEDKYKGNDGGKKQFCVSTQHYSFAVNAFVDLVKPGSLHSQQAVSGTGRVAPCAIQRKCFKQRNLFLVGHSYKLSLVLDFQPEISYTKKR